MEPCVHNLPHAVMHPIPARYTLFASRQAGVMAPVPPAQLLHATRQRVIASLQTRSPPPVVHDVSGGQETLPIPAFNSTGDGDAQPLPRGYVYLPTVYDVDDVWFRQQVGGGLGSVLGMGAVLGAVLGGSARIVIA